MATSLAVSVDVEPSSVPDASVAATEADGAEIPKSGAQPEDVAPSVDAVPNELLADASVAMDVGVESPPDTAMAITALDPNAATALAAEVAAAPPEALPVPPIGIYATAEEAALSYLEGARLRDPDRLWSVMSETSRTTMTQVVAKAKAAPDSELAKIGLARDVLDSMDGRMFFAHMVRHAPEPEPHETIGAMTTLPGATPDRVVVTYTLGKSTCAADAIKDTEGWKIEVSHCRESPRK